MNTSEPPIELLKNLRVVVQMQHDDFSKHGVHSARIALRGIGEGLDEVLSAMGDASTRKDEEGSDPETCVTQASPADYAEEGLEMSGGAHPSAPDPRADCPWKCKADSKDCLCLNRGEVSDVADKALLLAARWFKLYLGDETRYEHPASAADLVGMYNAMMEAREEMRAAKPEPVSIEAGAIKAARWRNGRNRDYYDFNALSPAEKNAYRDQVKGVAEAWGLSYVD